MSTTNPSIKILVGYHKPATLLKSDILVPIHLGRALATQTSKDGTMSEQDYQWMQDNMIGDDTGDNISHLNPYFAEMTAVYWAWKNYAKLGNPDYIGLCHYRRLFDSKAVADFLHQQGDILALKDQTYGGGTILRQFEKCHGQHLNRAIKTLYKHSPQYKEDVERYLNRDWGYFCNMFIMKKDLFFTYCQWIFPQLFEVHKTQNYPIDTAYNIRMPAFVGERLSGIFIQHQHTLNNKVYGTHCIWRTDTHIPKQLFPHHKDAINICFSADDAYAKYLCVSLQSLCAHANPNKYYDIFILDGGISEQNKTKLQSLADKHIRLTFVRATNCISHINKLTELLSKQPVAKRVNITTYFRLFIPEIFEKFDKVLYLDSDIIVLQDVALLYNTPMDTCLIAGAVDMGIQNTYYYNANFAKYSKEVLKIKNPMRYFNAGITLFNIVEMKRQKTQELFLQLIQKADYLMFDDQDVLNSICQDKIFPLDYAWNYEAQLDADTHYNHWLPLAHYQLHTQTKQPFILHYIFVNKPWKSLAAPHADIWWKYARQTPFYEMLLQDLRPALPSVSATQQTTDLQHIMLYADKIARCLLRGRYYRCKILAAITWGKKRAHYKQKRDRLHEQVRQIRRFLKN